VPSDSLWTLQFAVAINGSGQIVGWGTHAGTTAGFLLCPPESVREGNVNTGDGSCPADVIALNGSTGDLDRETFPVAGAPAVISIANAPSIATRGHYAVWILDGAAASGDEAEIRLAKSGGEDFDLGLGARCLPINNSEAPGSCPCPLTFATGMT